LRKQLLHLGRGTDSELLAEQALAQLILVDCITGIPVRQVDAHDGAMCALAQRLAGDAQEADLERLGESPCTRQPATFDTVAGVNRNASASVCQTPWKSPPTWFPRPAA